MMESETLVEPYLKYRVKKSKRVDYADTLEIILESDYVEEENFFYVLYQQQDCGFQEKRYILKR